VIVRRALITSLSLLVGCDLVLLSKNELPPADADLRCLRDSFDPPLSNNWQIYTTTPQMPALSAGKLEIPYDTMMLAVTEVFSTETFDFTGGDARILNLETLPVERTFAFTFFAIGIDDKHVYTFAVYSSGTQRNFSFARQDGDIKTEEILPYSPLTTKRWRFVHLPATNVMQWQTSETGEADNWSTRYELEATVPVTSIRFFIGTTSAGTAPPASAIYDDFEFCRP
jgi:hypothetical protein